MQCGSRDLNIMTAMPTLLEYSENYLEWSDSFETMKLLLDNYPN